MSRAWVAKLVIQVLTCGAALMVFLAIDGIVLAGLGFFATWIVGSGISMAVFRRLATPEERAADLRARADGSD